METRAQTVKPFTFEFSRGDIEILTNAILASTLIIRRNLINRQIYFVDEHRLEDIYWWHEPKVMKEDVTQTLYIRVDEFSINQSVILT